MLCTTAFKELSIQRYSWALTLLLKILQTQPSEQQGKGLHSSCIQIALVITWSQRRIQTPWGLDLTCQVILPIHQYINPAWYKAFLHSISELALLSSPSKCLPSFLNILWLCPYCGLALSLLYRGSSLSGTVTSLPGTRYEKNCSQERKECTAVENPVPGKWKGLTNSDRVRPCVRRDWCLQRTKSCLFGSRREMPTDLNRNKIAKALRNAFQMFLQMVLNFTRNFK